MFILFMPLSRTCKTGMNSRPCTGLPERCIAVSAGGFLKDKTLPSFRHIRYFHRRKYNVFFCWANKNAPQHTFLRHNGAICGEKKENGRKMTFPSSHPPAVFSSLYLSRLHRMIYVLHIVIFLDPFDQFLDVCLVFV